MSVLPQLGVPRPNSAWAGSNAAFQPMPRFRFGDLPCTNNSQPRITPEDALPSPLSMPRQPLRPRPRPHLPEYKPLPPRPGLRPNSSKPLHWYQGAELRRRNACFPSATAPDPLETG